MPSSLVTHISDLATRIGTAMKARALLVNGNAADNSALTTTAKSNLVLAINEVAASVAGKQAALGFTPENAANKGAFGGYAPLDGNAKVPAANLPSYVDDVLEYANLAAFPNPGESGKLYVDASNDREYRWSGTAYRIIVASPGTTDAVVEGTTNLYFTNTRAIAALAPSLGDTDTDYVAVFNAALA